MNLLKGIDRFDNLCGAFCALMAYTMGDHWVLFTAFFLLNVADWITGCIKSRLKGTESSAKGLNGAIKKLGYWILIALAFGCAAVFQELGSLLGLDLGITVLLGWFVLANLTINEIRSVLENLVESGYNIPTVLTKGLAVADKVLNQEEKKVEKEREED